ncbi:MAG: hypothetical protein VB962_07860 [Pseudohongiellaceae bacterium]
MMAAISFTKFHAIGVAKKYALVDGVATKTPAETFKTGSFEKVSVSSIAEFSDFIEKNGVLAMSIKAQRQKQTERDCIKRMRRLTRRLERLSGGVPQTVLEAMQVEGVWWSIPEWVKLGPGQPSEAQMSTMLEKSFEAQIQRLEAYWKRTGRDV